MRPPDEPYPEGVFKTFTLTFTLDEESGNYSIYCPEWKCELAGGQWPQDRARSLIAEIVTHNNMERSAEQ
jgi:hypothetical protein